MDNQNIVKVTEGKGEEQSMLEMLRSGKYADLTIECRERTWQVHKIIVCRASRLLAAECDRVWKESQSSLIKQNAFDAATMDRFLTYIYSEDYDLRQAQGPPSSFKGDLPIINPVDQATMDLIQHLQVFGIAEYYGVTELSQLSNEKFAVVMRTMGTSWPNLKNMVAAFNTYISTRSKLHATFARGLVARLGRDPALTKALIDELRQADASCEMIIDVMEYFAKYHINLDRERCQRAEEQTQAIHDQQKTIAAQRQEMAQVRYGIGNLVQGLENMPTACGGCRQVLGSFYVEELVTSTWLVRCTTCRCRLVK